VEAGSRHLTAEVRAVAVVVIAGAIMSILDTTIVNVALESLSRELHASLQTIQWVATGYLLALASVIPLTGWAAERFGPKRVWMTVVGAFVATSALCGLAPTANALIGFRVLQGFAGGMIMPIGMITLAQTAGPARMGRVMSIVGVPMLLAPVLGPVIGGLIVTNLSWRWIFYVNLPVGLVGLVLAARLMPAARAEGARPGSDRLDRVGLLLLSPGVALIVYGLSEVAARGSLDPLHVVLPLLAGLLLVAAFVLHAWRHSFPLVDVRLLRVGGFGAAAVTVFLVGAALFGGMLLLPLYYQSARGLSALDAGLLLAPQGLGAAVAMRSSGPLTDRVGGGPVVVAGLVILSLATLPFTQVGPGSSYALLSLALLGRGVGLGFTMMPAMASAFALLARGQVPRATPMLNVVQRIGGSIGVAVLAVVLQREVRHALPGPTTGHGTGASVASLPPGARAHVAGPIAGAFGHTYWWATALTVIALPAALALWREQRRARAMERAEARLRGAPAPLG
jgi:EmrB/QacA subfamily drug resistance transporter